MSNPLDPIMEWYRTAYDSMRVTRRVVEKGTQGVLTHRHVFFDRPADESTQRLQESVEELGNMVVLALVAVFERMLREFVVSVVQNSLSDSDPVQERIRFELESDVEYWQFSERLVDAFQTVSAGVRGQIKQLIEFRNWIAHGHFLAQSAPVRTDPQRAYDRLTMFLKTAGILS